MFKHCTEKTDHHYEHIYLKIYASFSFVIEKKHYAS